MTARLSLGLLGSLTLSWVCVVLVVRAVVPSLSDPADPGKDPGQQTCPRVTSSASPQQGSTGDRVRSGALSYLEAASEMAAQNAAENSEDRS